MRGRRPWRAASPLLALVLLPAAAGAQVRAGAEFRVNTFTAGYQYSRANAAAASADGRFVVVWESGGMDGSFYAAMGQRFDANGARLGSDFIVNTYTTQDQGVAAVAMSPSGRFVVTWQSEPLPGNPLPGQDGSGQGVFGQRFDRQGARTGAEFRVNTFTTDQQSRASVAIDPGGSFVVAWRSASVFQPQDGDLSGIFAQRFSNAAATLGSEFQVNAYTTQYQSHADVGRAADGSFVVVWQSNDQEGAASGYGIFARRYGNDGLPIGAEFRVNSYTTGDQAYPSVGVDAAGNFVVAWMDYNSRDGSGTAIMGQRYSSTGSALGSEFQVNGYTTGYQYWPQVGMASDGGAFVVAWGDFPRDGSGAGIFGRKFNSSGTAVGSEFQANSYTSGAQYNASVGIDPVGNFTVVWTSGFQDGSLSGVYAQRFGGLVPAALNVDTVAGGSENGNRVLDPGETVDVRPSWRNVNGASQTFTATLSNMTGPPGATYTITNSTGDYGTVPNNSVGACTNCYAVFVSNPATRPAFHWDASALETLTPATQGQQKRWLLHVGASFIDVPVTGTFYRFIETLLHYSVTGGCSGNTYCPANVASRDQMSVFVLVAKEGPGYTPPACTTPVFADVPASSPFCRFIEELVRRGVVTGCGSGNYCPTNPVTREQMAVFVLRTLDPALNPPACVAGSEQFADVPASSPFCKWIEELVRRGVVTGCGGGNYCPTQSVTREQMSVFITVTFGLTLYGP